MIFCLPATFAMFRKPLEDFLKAVDEVTSQDITEISQKLVSSPLTMASYGEVINVPTYDAVSSMFKSKWFFPSQQIRGRICDKPPFFVTANLSWSSSSMVPFLSLSINRWIFGQQHLIFLTLPYGAFFPYWLCNLYLPSHRGKRRAYSFEWHFIDEGMSHGVDLFDFCTNDIDLYK